MACRPTSTTRVPGSARPGSEASRQVALGRPGLVNDSTVVVPPRAAAAVARRTSGHQMAMRVDATRQHVAAGRVDARPPAAVPALPERGYLPVGDA